MTSSEIQSLQEEISDLRSYLDGLPPDYRDGSYGSTYRSRLDSLLEELTDKQLLLAATVGRTPLMNIRLSGTLTDGQRIPAQVYGIFLQLWQWLYSALGQAATGRPTTRGAIPREILEQLQFDVLAHQPGSFITTLAAPPLPVTQQSLFGKVSPISVEAFRSVQEIVDAGEREQLLRAVMHLMKGRVLSAYASVLELLAKNEIDLAVGFAQPDGNTMGRIKLPASLGAAVLPLVRKIAAIEETEIALDGILSGANRRTGTFELDLGDEGVVTGKFGAHQGFLDGALIGQRYTFRLLEIVTQNQTGAMDTEFQLVDKPTRPEAG